MCRDRNADIAPDRPCLSVGRLSDIDLAAHYHGDELVGRAEIRLVEAVGVLGIRVTGGGRNYTLPSALEIAEGGTTPGIEQRLHGGVRMFRRVMDLRHVVHCGDAVVELA